MQRPLIRYYGSKYRLAPFIISNFPEHKVYIEPFGGSAGVLLRKPPSWHEVYNDLDGELYNLFTVLKNPSTAAKLKARLSATPYAKVVYEASYQPTSEPVEQAWQFIVRSHLGFSASSCLRKTGFISTSKKATYMPIKTWPNVPNQIDWYTERLQSVAIDNRDALQLIQAHDSEHALFYIDPPYLQATRYYNRKKIYRYEYTPEEHTQMLHLVNNLSGKVVISGYDNELYNDLLIGWKKVSKNSLTDGRNTKKEILWIKDNINLQRTAALHTAKIKRSKTEKQIISAIEVLRQANQKVTKTAVANKLGISRANLSRRYTHLFVSPLTKDHDTRTDLTETTIDATT